MIDPEQAVDLLPMPAKPPAEFRPRYPLLPRPQIQQHLQRRQKRQPHGRSLANARDRNVLAMGNATGNRLLERINRMTQRVRLVLAKGCDLGQSRAGDEERVVGTTG